MIWGEVINSVRSAHLSLIHEFNIDPKIFLNDIEFTRAKTEFPFPQEIDDFDEWDELLPVPALEDILPLHPVERVLLEGPILPIQKIQFQSKIELDGLFITILNYEKEWAEKSKIMTPAIEKFLERIYASQALKLATRLGFSRLGTV
jgi:hypothetical protein